MKKILKKSNIIVLIFGILSIVSLRCLYGLTDYFYKQIIWIVIGIILFIIIKNVKFKYLSLVSIPLYLISILLLLGVILFGKEINGSKAWIDLKFFSLQPSELTKISLFLLTPRLIKKKTNIFLILILFAIPTILTYLEPDTGAIIIYIIILLITIINIPSKHIKWGLLIIMFISITSLIGLYFYNQDLFIKMFGKSIFYRIDRLTSFTNQDSYQLNNALISIGAHKCLYFPEYHTDFIFALLLCKLNMSYLIITLFSYFVIFIILIMMTNKSKDKKNNLYPKYLFYILLYQVFQNIFMNIGLLPIIGLPLPLLSYGGSHLISSYMMFGIVFNKKN